MFSVRFQQLLCCHCEELAACNSRGNTCSLSKHDACAMWQNIGDSRLVLKHWQIAKLKPLPLIFCPYTHYYLNDIVSPNLHFCKSSHDGHDGYDGHNAPSLSSSMMVTILLLFCPSCILGEVVTSWSSTANDSGDSNTWSFWIETVTVCIKVSGLNITSVWTAV